MHFRIDGSLRLVALFTALASPTMGWAVIGQAPAAKAALDVERQVLFDPQGTAAAASAALSGSAPVASDAGRLAAYRQLAIALDELEETQQALRYADTGIELARQMNDIEAQCQLMMVRANAQIASQSIAAAQQTLRQAETLAEQHQLPRQRSRALYALGWMTHASLGHSAEALVLMQSAYSLAESAGDRYGMALSLAGMAGVNMSSRGTRAERLKSVEQYQRALELVDAKVHRSFVLGTTHNYGIALLRQGEHAQARRLFENALTLSNTLGNRPTTASLRTQIALIAVEEGKAEDALRHLDVAQPVLDELGTLSMRLLAQLTRAKALAMQGQAAASQAALREARGLLPDGRPGAMQARFHEAAAFVYERLGASAKAYEELQLLREAERVATDQAKDDLAAELRARFDLERQQHDNALLREKESAASARQWMLVLALTSALLFVGLLAVSLRAQIQRKKELTRLAFMDDLTGLPNRRSILGVARTQFERHSHSHGDLHLSILDIDHFKQINDMHGHDVGDLVLKAFAQACSKALRDTDSLGRQGGEEFLLVLPHSDGAAIAEIFTRLRAAVQAAPVPELGRAVTFSMGAAARQGGGSFEDLVKAADEALYEAKRSGRDRCVVA